MPRRSTSRYKKAGVFKRDESRPDRNQVIWASNAGDRSHRDAHRTTHRRKNRPGHVVVRIHDGGPLQGSRIIAIGSDGMMRAVKRRGTRARAYSRRSSRHRSINHRASMMRVCAQCLRESRPEDRKSLSSSPASPGSAPRRGDFTISARAGGRTGRRELTNLWPRAVEPSPSLLPDERGEGAATRR